MTDISDLLAPREANLEDLIVYLTLIRDSLGNMPVMIGQNYNHGVRLESVFCAQKHDEDLGEFSNPVCYLTMTNAISSSDGYPAQDDSSVLIQPVYTFGKPSGEFKYYSKRGINDETSSDSDE